MRATGVMHPTDGPYVPPDTVNVLLLTGGSSAQASDWLSSGSTALADAGTGAIHIVKITGMTTAGAALGLTVSLDSTRATVPSSGQQFGSTGIGQIPIMQPTFFQIPGGSTGWSAAAFTSGYVIVEQWRK